MTAEARTSLRFRSLFLPWPDAPNPVACEAWPDHLERNLSREHDRVEVFNVAVPGWTARQQRIAYERFVRPYHVDDVVLGVCLNDVPEMQNNLAPGRIPDTLLWLHRHSALVRRVVDARAREIARVEELLDRDGAANVENAWNLRFDEILALREDVDADGARLTVIVFPYRFQVLEGAPDPVAQERLAEFCRRHGIPFLDMLDSLRELSRQALIDHNHLSPRGSREAAKHLADSGLLQPPQAD